MANRVGKCAGILIFGVGLGLTVGNPARAAEAAPGRIKISVDATHAPQRILHAKLEIPTRPGPLTLYYPKWMPADHSPDGPISNLGGLHFTAGGKEIAWRQDLVDMYAFNLDIPEGVKSVDVSLDFMISAPGPTIDFSASGSAKLFILMWNQVVLYPKGWPAAELVFDPALSLPPGWKFNTSLPIKSQVANTIAFLPVALDLLIDSPVQAGEFVRVFPLNSDAKPKHEVDVVADDAWALDVPPALIANYTRLVAEAGTLYQSHHYRDYHFLLTLSDNVLFLGQEHHESSDDRVAEHTLADPNARLLEAGLFPHEFTHSWNGQYRRPEGLATPDFQQPMKGELLWVYEGLTDYLGTVLTARSGLLTPAQTRDQIALTASTMEHRAGRRWRSLQNTANAAQILYFAPQEWAASRRGTDFYAESVLIWLDVDATIRKLTSDRKSLDDFCHAFYGPPDGEPVVKTYNFTDLVSTLNQIAAHDWSSFFRERLDSTDAAAPLGGITGGGWKLVYTDDPNELLAAGDAESKGGDFTSSIGVRVRGDGTVIDAIPGMPGFDSGVSPYLRIVAVNGKQFSVDEMKGAIRDSKSRPGTIELVTTNTGRLETHAIRYEGGNRYPHLERIEGTPDYLDEILKPLTPVSAH
ncbi:MAG: M61 family metallopeptidase [Acidipila sp.]|nr:M61 family metallopeptidase [Acidipila sp.]